MTNVACGSSFSTQPPLSFFQPSSLAFKFHFSVIRPYEATTATCKKFLRKSRNSGFCELCCCSPVSQKSSCSLFSIRGSTTCNLHIIPPSRTIFFFESRDNKLFHSACFSYIAHSATCPNFLPSSASKSCCSGTISATFQQLRIYSTACQSSFQANDTASHHQAKSRFCPFSSSNSSSKCTLHLQQTFIQYPVPHFLLLSLSSCHSTVQPT